jgi:hypothetical protein
MQILKNGIRASLVFCLACSSHYFNLSRPLLFAALLQNECHKYDGGALEFHEMLVAIVYTCMYLNCAYFTCTKLIGGSAVGLHPHSKISV